MRIRFTTALLACTVLVGCGNDIGMDPPRLTDDIDWAVRVRIGDHYCTASLLSEHWLLTAGHCLYDGPEAQVVVSHEIFGERTVVYEGAAELIVHPDYDEIGTRTHRWNDIGLVGLLDGAIEVGERARLSGADSSFDALWSGEHPIYAVGYGRVPDPKTGECGDELGSKKRYDGLLLLRLLGPLFGGAREVELDGRPDSLCDGDSGGPLLIDLHGIPHAFAVFSGRALMRDLFYGTLSGRKIGWFESATESTHAPLDCVDLGGDSWECRE